MNDNEGTIPQQIAHLGTASTMREDLNPYHVQTRSRPMAGRTRMFQAKCKHPGLRLTLWAAHPCAFCIWRIGELCDRQVLVAGSGTSGRAQ
jgi:adenylosuccinate lyase